MNALCVALLGLAIAQSPDEDEDVRIHIVVGADDSVRVEGHINGVGDIEADIEEYVRGRLQAVEAVHFEPPAPPTPPARPRPRRRSLNDDRVSFSGPVVVGVDERVESAVSFGHDVRVRGECNEGATSFGGDVVVTSSGRVIGDAVSFGGRVVVEPGGEVLGDRVALGMSVPLAPVAPVIEASTTHHPAARMPSTSLFESLYHHLVLFFSLTGAGAIVIGLFPARVGRVAAAVDEHPLRSAVAGTLIAVGLVLAASLFAITIIGLPVTFLLLSVLGLAWLFGFVGLCRAVGEKLPFREKPHGHWFALLVGSLILTSLGSLSWIGWMVVFGASVIAIGASASSRLGGR